MTTILHHEDAEVQVQPVSGNKNRITVKLKNSNIFIPRDVFETSYPVELIEGVLKIKGPVYLCDEIMREDSPGYVEQNLNYDILGYIQNDSITTPAILDFGCGSGASTMILCRMFPNAEITGIELEKDMLEIASLRAEHHKVDDRVRFLSSPGGSGLPENIGTFDYIFLIAVYEHLLPEERLTILPLLWDHLKPGGILFINQTPFRWFPVESHTTGGLLFINYLPGFAASFYARRFSRRNLANDSWPRLLRKGIRGGSAGEILKILNGHPGPAVILEPGLQGFTDRIDIWYSVSVRSRLPVIKKVLFHLFKLIKTTTGQIFLPTLSLAIKKAGGGKS
jgi:SAM-dependent methyltransferase